MNRLSKGEQIFLGAGVVLFVLFFISPWAKVSLAGFGSESGNGWESYGLLGKLAALLVLAGVIVAGLKLAGQNLSNVPSVAWVGAAGGATLLLLLMLVFGPADEGASAFGIDVERGFMLYVGVLLGAAMTYGAYAAMEGSMGSSGTGTGGAAPPPTA